jgi:hypothetical protein
MIPLSSPSNLLLPTKKPGLKTIGVEKIVNENEDLTTQSHSQPKFFLEYLKDILNTFLTLSK